MYNRVLTSQGWPKIPDSLPTTVFLYLNSVHVKHGVLLLWMKLFAVESKAALYTRDILVGLEFFYTMYKGCRHP